ncbi:succinate dehydrogenase/fumarate reductase flavo protein [Pseudovirgaria hyperparasitica]|uniref:Succinate dehydrogenase/fumarate reductase flavo protein n=1 Tax=Pseudovirgaria hyperparasitica TaxID=470096 RepID=A0A6A6VUN0_9PEZI|nr:succinate dehydrogenase/fumarate reductase flavo protein [Pseudovirgaria hyperparasitica]KAF2753865.1 succinate dehydrogenase/fumarate reductase flavo protein [Pseudovirgaria hyperparasitica]
MSKIGGTTTYPGGELWVPNNHPRQAARVVNSYENAFQYLEAIIDDVGPTSSCTRKEAFLKAGPTMPGALVIERAIEPKIFDEKKLGVWRKRPNRPPGRARPPLYTSEGSKALLSVATWGGNFQLLRIIARWIGRKLLVISIRRVISLRTGMALVRLLRNSNTNTSDGAVLEQSGRELIIRTRKSVILAVGGFAYNKDMRATYQPFFQASNEPAYGFFILFGRARPHLIIVDSSVERFMNEAQSYIYAAIPVWIIVDSQFIRERAIDTGFLFEGRTILELAQIVGVNVPGLNATILRFNQMARHGKDLDHNRGGNAYDRQFGDPLCKPIPNLGTIESAPFFALKIFPGDLGTKGGLYAAGNSSSSVIGRTYAGVASTLALAMTFAFLAAEHMSGANQA